VIAATDDEAVNQQVSDAAESRRIFCNVVDAPKQASFIMPSIIDRSPLMVAVSSGGTSPVLARLLRENWNRFFRSISDTLPAMQANCVVA
jgi:uroporphyrin-III C-methyltransferase/precorrin-2 dehydrogenase/sirohydrochlorin ferrochelatase